MAHPGFNPADERMWWWKVAKHLDDAQLALLNAMAHHVDDPRPLQDLQARLREGQAILLYIFGAKGLLPGAAVATPQHAQHAQHAQQPVPPPPWTPAASDPPPPWFPTDMAGDIAAAAAAAAAAAVVTPAPTGDRVESVSPVSPEVDQHVASVADGEHVVSTAVATAPTNGEAHHATEAEASHVDPPITAAVQAQPEVPATTPPSPGTPSSDTATQTSSVPK